MRYLVFIALLIPGAAFAAVLNPLEVVSTPAHPGPGVRTTIRANYTGGISYTTAYRFEIDDKIVSQGTGDSIDIDAPKAGGSTTIVVTAYVNGVARATNTFVLAPTALALVWEGRTSVPPTAGILPLAAAGAPIVATALHSFNAPESSIRYEWSLNGAVQPKLSGFGKNTVSLVPPFFNDSFRLSVVATVGSDAAEAGVTITPQAPDIVAYVDSPLAGARFDNAIVDVYNFTNSEVSFIAYPLYVADPYKSIFRWLLENTPIAIDGTDQYRTVFKKTGSASGSRTVKMELTNDSNFLEQADRSFLLQF